MYTQAALFRLGPLRTFLLCHWLGKVRTKVQFSREGQQLHDSKFSRLRFLVTPQAGCAGFRSQPLGGGCHGYWEEEAICVEMNVSMTLWLDGNRWLWPLVDSELWYSTRLLEDTAEASDTAGCPPSPS